MAHEDSDRGARSGRPAELVVFSHPNHELAIFGLLQRWRPALLYLTDGGGADRIAQTREGLGSIGLLESATFLDHTEASFYQALLDRDVAFFENVAAEIGEVIRMRQPARVLCDAVEYYNPVHDLSLPLVLRGVAAGACGRPVDVLEIPLIRQLPSTAEEYAVQRPSSTTAGDPLEFRLTEAELSAKIAARDRVYTLLLDQLGSVLTGLSSDHLATETVLPARPLTGPEDGGCLRYERRAALLLRQGLIERAITYAGHFQPIASSLTGALQDGNPMPV